MWRWIIWLSLLKRLLALSPLLLALALFLAISLRQLHLPGLYYDEAFDLVPMLQLINGEQPELLRNIGVAGWPVMRMDYMGSLNGYLTIPFINTLGSGYIAARTQPIFFSAITVLLTWLLARRWFGWRVAVVCTLLLAVSPSFVWFSRQGITVTSVMTVFALSGILLLDVARHAIDAGDSVRARQSIFAAGILFGLGVWAKIIFVWWIALMFVMGVVWLLTRSQAARAVSPINPWPNLGSFVAGGLLGGAPFLYYNLAGLLMGEVPGTFGLLFRSLGSETQYGQNNLAFLTNLSKRWQDFETFLNGSYFWFLASVPYGNALAGPMFLAAVIVGSLLATRREEWRKWIALITCIMIYLPISSFTVSDLWATHFFILLPLPQLVLACAAVWLAEAVIKNLMPRSRRIATWSAVLAVLLATPQFARDVWVNVQYHEALTTSGGSGRFSDAIYKLAAHMEAEQIFMPIALDWGISQQLRVLTSDRVRPVEIFGFSVEPNEVFLASATEALADPDRTYIVLWDKFAVFNRRAAFTRLAESMGRQVKETYIAHERTGQPVYVLLQAR